MIGNLHKSALSHFEISCFCFCRIRLRCDKFSCEAGVRLSLFFVVRFVAQSHDHWNLGSVSFLGGLVFKRLFSVRDNYILKMIVVINSSITLECLI